MIEVKVIFYFIKYSGSAKISGENKKFQFLVIKRLEFMENLAQYFVVLY